jgi:hypothetical protein
LKVYFVLNKFSWENFPNYFYKKEVLNDNFIIIYDDESIGLGIVKMIFCNQKLYFKKIEFEALCFVLKF